MSIKLRIIARYTLVCNCLYNSVLPTFILYQCIYSIHFSLWICVGDYYCTMWMSAELFLYIILPSHGWVIHCVKSEDFNFVTCHKLYYAYACDQYSYRHTLEQLSQDCILCSDCGFENYVLYLFLYTLNLVFLVVDLFFNQIHI